MAVVNRSDVAEQIAIDRLKKLFVPSAPTYSLRLAG